MPTTYAFLFLIYQPQKKEPALQAVRELLSISGRNQQKSTSRKQCLAVAGCPNFARGNTCTTHRTKRLCCVHLCASAVVVRGLCKLHGAYGMCSFNTQCLAVAVGPKGFCGKHRVNGGQCTTPGCPNASRPSSTNCSTHGGGTRKRKLCTVEGCTAQAKFQGICYKHGAHGACQVPACCSNARQGSPFCSKHGGRKKLQKSSVPGCSSTSQVVRLPVLSMQAVCEGSEAHVGS